MYSLRTIALGRGILRVPTTVQISRATFCSHAGYGNATSQTKTEASKFEYHEYGLPKEQEEDSRLDPILQSSERVVKKKKSEKKTEKREKAKQTKEQREKLQAGDQNAMRDFSEGL
eukprot:TRINITY_DN334_c0_g1_i10.p1 TRINITY_DN334_c0_g1~~TRINITY_DN334_c0_g1_i10.p1  ORF type:complete len:116 (-),score=25.29 TRINITY_DN334_c0_g1_i10:180-527(-)